MKVLCLWLLMVLAAGCASPAVSHEDAAVAQEALSTCVTFRRDLTGGVADTQISNAPPPSGDGVNKNFGASTVLNAGTYYSTGMPPVESDRQTLIQVDLSSIATGATVTSADLAVTVFASTGSGTVSAYLIPMAWGESTVTWANFGEMYDTPAVASSASIASGRLHMDVLSVVQAWVATPSTNFGALLDEDNDSIIRFWSSEAYAAGFAPVTSLPSLTVCYQ